MNTALYCTDEHFRKAEDLVRQMHANDGLAPIDLDAFWRDHEKAVADPWARDMPQAPLGVMMNHLCVFDELGIPEDVWRLTNDAKWRGELIKAYNDKAETIVGRRVLNETVSDPNLQYPETKKLHDVFEAEQQWHIDSWWLKQSANTPEELAALLDRVENRDIRRFILPDNWRQERDRLMALGVKPSLYRGQRGPVTFATSIYGVENLIFLILDKPALAERFRDAILHVVLEIARVLDEEAGYTPKNAPRGFYFCDDNSCLLNPEMYELFGAPILKGIWDRYSPDPDDMRGQHSDSSMEHLLPILGRLGITSTNFGPTVKVSDIRKHCPKALILGQLAPFTFSRNEEVNIVAEFLRDCDMAGDARGWIFGTAGSINNGSRLTGMRLIMSAIQRYGRYGA